MKTFYLFYSEGIYISLNLLGKYVLNVLKQATMYRNIIFRSFFCLLNITWFYILKLAIKKKQLLAFPVDISQMKGDKIKLFTVLLF